MSQVAERIYYNAPDVLEFEAQVTAIRELARVNGAPVWQIALDRTAFYPTSGGQPHDTGVLVATARSGASLQVPISSVDEDPSGEVWHTTSKPLQEGTAVRGRVDAGRRRDHMQQHSGQHLLSAVLDREFQARTVSFHLGETESTIDLEGAALDANALERTELLVNDAIRGALPISIRYVSVDQAEAMKAAGVLRKLPPRSGELRIVEIAGLDVNACGGTHVRSTAEIGPLLLRGTESVRGTTRLSFVCGDRAIKAARNDFRLLQSLAHALTTSVDALPASVDRIKTEQKQQAKSVAALLQDVAALEAAALGTSEAPVVHRVSDGRDAAYAKLLAARIVRDTPACLALVTAPDAEKTSIVLAAKPGAMDCGTALRTALALHGGRGGGSSEMAQGAVDTASVDAVIATVLQREERCL